MFSLTVNMHGIVSFEVPTLPKMCTIIVTVQADTQMSKVAFSIRMRALLPFTGVLQDRNKYLLVSMYHSMLYSFIPARYSLVVTWLHGDFVVWVQGAPNTLD